MVDQVRGGGRDPARDREAPRADLAEQPLSIFVVEWQVAGEEREEDDAARPDVRLLADVAPAPTADHLGGGVVWAATRGLGASTQADENCLGCGGRLPVDSAYAFCAWCE